LKPAAAESESADPHASTEEPRNNLATEGTEDTEGTENSENPKKADRTEGRDTIVLTDLPFFDLSIEAALEPGDWVLSAGNAFKVADGSEPVSVAHGVFSGRTRLDARRRTKDYDYHGEVLAIDAMTSNPGAAGSALVNLRGELVGIVGREVESNLTHTYFNYAIPRDVLYEFFRGASRSAADAGTAHGAGEPPPPPAPIPTLEWGDLGVKLATAGYRRVLPFVERVRIGSPAFMAGLRRDDLILSVNGRSVPDIEDCERRLRMLDRGAAVDLVIRRGESIRTIRIETKGGP
jgi:serine protease Do